MADEQGEMIRDLVRNFVKRELMPLEMEVLRRQSTGQEALSVETENRLRALSKELGLWGMDAPTELGGMDLPATIMLGVVEDLARTIVPFQFPPDSPNLRMLQAAGSPAQKERYLKPYIDGTMASAIAISEPGAGSDPAGLATRAVRTEGGWTLNGRKIWISGAKRADFIVVLARVGEGKRHEGITAFIVEKGTSGFVIEREISMLGGGFYTYEIVFENCHVPEDALLGLVGQGYKPMQLRLITRRLQMGALSIGTAQRALDILIEHARVRVTFGVPLAERQAVQWWIANTAMKLHACKLMVQNAAQKVDRGEDVRSEASMIKVFATEMAAEAVDNAMQTLGALGLATETPLFALWQRVRLMRIYEGPSEVHRQNIAERVIAATGAGR